MEQLINWLANILENTSWWGLPADVSAAVIVWSVYGFILALVVAPMAMIVLTWLERKIIARIQDRIGPNRAGPFGLLQAVADAIKMLTKEDTTPAGADRVPFNIGPGLAAVAAILIYAVIPVAPGIVGTDLNIGIFYIVAVGSFGVLGILMAGWSSNNKYALLGAFRAVSQLVSYEIPMVLSLITIAVVAGSMSTVTIVDKQSWVNGGWYLIAMPVTFLLFFLSSVAEVGRSPFDLLEADSEIVAGFHVEYSGLKFGLFMIAEYVHALAVAALTATLFLGGWHGPFVTQLTASSPVAGAILGHIYFLLKVGVIVFILMWFRGTLPRFRIDQLLDFGWKFMTPVALLNLLVTAFVVKLFQPGVSTGMGYAISAGPLASFGGVGQTIALLIANLLVAFLVSLAVRAFARRSKAQALRAVAAVEN